MAYDKVVDSTALDASLTAVADAIRVKTGEEKGDGMTLADMPTKIEGITTKSSIDVAAMTIGYTLSSTDSDSSDSTGYTDYGVVTMTDGNQYRLLEFRKSGTLLISEQVNCEACIVGAGLDGKTTLGGAGGYLQNIDLLKYYGGLIYIGAAPGGYSGIINSTQSKEYYTEALPTVLKNAPSTKYYQTGGTGGGQSYNDKVGYGDGKSKYPFNDTSYTLWNSKPLCAGGGGGSYRYYDTTDGTTYYLGGEGGTNGGDGAPKVTSTSAATKTTGGAGGSFGGGTGGGWYSTNDDGTNATTYGSGGGGYGTYPNNSTQGNVGSGYQGVVYLRIPVEQ